MKSNHFPLANFYEALIFLTWGLVTLNFFLLFGNDFLKARPRKSIHGETLAPREILFSDPTFSGPGSQSTNGKRPVSFLSSMYNRFLYMLSKPQKKIYGGILAPCILFIIAFAQFNLSSEFSPLVPALKSNWLLMHVSIMIFSYTIFIVAGLTSLILIIQNYYGPKKKQQLTSINRSEIQNNSGTQLKTGEEKSFALSPSRSPYCPPDFPTNQGDNSLAFHLGILQDRNRIISHMDSIFSPIHDHFSGPLPSQKKGVLKQ